MNVSLKLGVAACAALLALPASAETLDATNPRKLVEVIQDLGYRARLETDGVGDPMIISSAAGAEFRIYFYGCSRGKDCTTLLFKAGFDLIMGTTLETVDAWNEGALLGRAYLDDEDDPWIELGVNMKGGVSRSNFEVTFGRWESILSDFQRHIDF